MMTRICFVFRVIQGMNAASCGGRAAAPNKSIGDGGVRCERKGKSKQANPGPASGQGWTEGSVWWLHREWCVPVSLWFGLFIVVWQGHQGGEVSESKCLAVHSRYLDTKKLEAHILTTALFPFASLYRQADKLSSHPSSRPPSNPVLHFSRPTLSRVRLIMCHRVVTFIIALIATSSGAFIVPSFTSFSSATLSSSSQSPFHSHRTISMAPSGVPPVAPSNFLFASPNDDSPPSSSNPLTPLLIRLGYKTDTAAEDPRTLREKLKDFGLAGVVSYIASEVLFWFISLPVGIFAFHQSTGEWLDLSTSEGQGKVGMERDNCRQHLCKFLFLSRISPSHFLLQKAVLPPSPISCFDLDSVSSLSTFPSFLPALPR